MTWTTVYSLGRSLCALVLVILMLLGTVGYGCEDLHGHDMDSQEAQTTCVCICSCHGVMIATLDQDAIPDPLPVSQQHSLTDEVAPALAFVSGIDRPPEI